MITSDNIYKAIRNRLEEIFQPEELQIKDIKNVVSPCLYIEYVSSADTEVANDTYRSNGSFNIVYFAVEDTLLNLVEVENKLKKGFKQALRVEYINSSGNPGTKFLKPKISSAPNVTEEYYLSMSLNFEFLQDADGIDDEYCTGEFDNSELMENLEID